MYNVQETHRHHAETNWVALLPWTLRRPHCNSIDHDRALRMCWASVHMKSRRRRAPKGKHRPDETMKIYDCRSQLNRLQRALGDSTDLAKFPLVRLHEHEQHPAALHIEFAQSNHASSTVMSRQAGYGPTFGKPVTVQLCQGSAASLETFRTKVGYLHPSRNLAR